MKEDFILIPKPKKINFKDGYYVIKNNDYISFPKDDKNELYPIVKRLKDIIRASTSIELPVLIGKYDKDTQVVTFENISGMPEEAYKLVMQPKNIKIIYGYSSGAFHAVSTLKQVIKQYGNILPCMEIYDEPDFKHRGLMIDISRDKIPAMNTLYRIVDFMADVKLNQLQLYVEGMSFAYQSFTDTWKEGNPITGEEIIELDRYCRERYIELVPNQNSFGHMAKWLERREFNDMAECPEGYEAPWGRYEKPATFNPTDEKVIPVIEKMYDDLLPYFSSNIFNVGCDETFELGMGKSKVICKEIGKGRVYLDFLIKIYNEVKKRGKKMMFWADIIIQYPELVDKIPKDITALEWGYEENHPFEEHCRKLKKSGIPFYVCPGTSTWGSITGRTENMMGNMISAAVYGKKYDADGYLCTDWGDAGHWQYLPVSYAAFTYSAALSWGVEENKNENIASYLNNFIYQDKNSEMGDFALKLGNYYLLESKRVPNATNTFFILQQHLEDMNLLENLKIEDFENIKKYSQDLLEQLNKSNMQCDDADIIYEEFRNSIRFIRLGADMGILKFNIKNGLEEKHVQELQEELLEDASVLIKNHKIVWLKRNRMGGLEDSIKHLWLTKIK